MNDDDYVNLWDGYLPLCIWSGRTIFLQGSQRSASDDNYLGSIVASLFEQVRDAQLKVFWVIRERGFSCPSLYYKIGLSSSKLYSQGQ